MDTYIHAPARSTCIQIIYIYIYTYIYIYIYAPARSTPAADSAGRLHIYAVYGSVIARLFVLPFAGLALMRAFEKMSLLPDDPLLKFVLLLQVTYLHC